MHNRQWLTEEIEKLRQSMRGPKSYLCSRVEITFKTLRKYQKEDSTPQLTATQWLNFAKVLGLDPGELLHRFTDD